MIGRGAVIAHLEKYTAAAAGHLTAHYERRKYDCGKYNGEYIRFGNQNIDISRTPQNYNLAPVRDTSQIDFIRQRVGEVKCMNRKDVNVMCDWVVTAPTGVRENELTQFFRETYSFLEARYGSRNVISAHVHMDEVTPHMHFAFVPVIYDSRKRVYKVSAKELISRTDLKTFHPDLEEHLAGVFGRELGILNDATKEGNRSVQELKRQTAVERMQDAENRIKIAENIYQEKILIIREVIKDIDRQKYEIETMSAKLDEVKAEIQQSVQIRGKLEMEISRLGLLVDAERGKLEHFQNMVGGRALSAREMQDMQPQRTVTGTIKGVTLEDIENLKTTAVRYLETLEKLRYSQGQCERYKEDAERYRRQVPSIDEQVQVERDRRELQLLRKAFAQLPEPIRQEVLRRFEQKKGQQQQRGHAHER